VSTGNDPDATLMEGRGRVALVTGATGFVGSHVAEVLRENGWKVRLLVRSASRLIPELQPEHGYEIVKGALEDDIPALAACLGGVDVVFHVAGLIGATKQADFDRVNVEGTRRLIGAVAASGSKPARFLLVSSMAAFGPDDGLGRPRKEDDPPQPRTMYGKSKLAGEQLAWELCRTHGIPLTVVRPPAVYGPRDKAILEFFTFMARGIEVGFGKDKRRLDLIHGRDLARGIVMAACSNRSEGEAYFLTDGGCHLFTEVMAKLRGALRPRRNLRFISPVWVVRLVAKCNDVLQGITGKVRLPNSDKLGELLPLGWCCDGSKAREHFGFECRIPLEQGLRETGEWYERAGWIKVRR
jgi:nucleoside-diphosphate-sugar epimerase